MEQHRFTERVRIITGLIVRFLRQFTVPTQLDTDELQVERVRLTAEAINGFIATGAADDEVRVRVAAACDHIVRTHRASTWPTVAHFVAAMNETLPHAPAEPVSEYLLPPEDMSLRERRFRIQYRGERYPARTREETEAALSEPVPRIEWDHHIDVLCRLRMQSPADVHATEVGWYRANFPERLPVHLSRREAFA